MRAEQHLYSVYLEKMLPKRALHEHITVWMC